MTKTELAEIMVEFQENYYTKYHAYKEVTYTYNGEERTREERYMTEEGERLQKLGDIKMFTCPTCGRLVSFNELSYFAEPVEDLIADTIECEECYNESMGEEFNSALSPDEFREALKSMGYN